MRLGLICNSTSAFPVLDWLHSQNVLISVATTAIENEFSSDLNLVCSQRNIIPRKFTKKELQLQMGLWLKDNGIDIVLVLGFPYKIPQEILKIPKLGIYNFHFGKLPKYAGSFPVFWQILNREKEACLTIHQMDGNFDTGLIAFEIPFEILPHYPLGSVEVSYSYTAINGCFLLLDSILKNNLILKPQVDSERLYFKKPKLKDLIINWNNQTSEEIYALVKACNPWNKGAIARINGFDLKIVETALNNNLNVRTPGAILGITQEGIEVGCNNNTSLTIKIISSTFGYLNPATFDILGLNVGDCFEEINI